MGFDGTRMMSADEHSWLRLSERGGFTLAVAAAHALAFYGLAQWGPVRETLFQSPPLEVALITETEPQPELPPPPAPRLDSLTLPVLVPPEIPLPAEPPPAPKAITVALREAPPPSPEPAAGKPRMISEVAYIRPPQPKYPPESRRYGEEGLVVLRVLIDQLGRAADVRIEQSSGHARLDAAALEAVRRAQFRPYIENGVARAAQAMIPIEFTWRSRADQRRAQRG